MTIPRAREAESNHGFRVRVLGIVRGRDIDAHALASLLGKTLVLAWENAGAWQIDLDGLDGIMPGGDQLTLYLTTGDVLELEDNESLRMFAKQLLDAACAMPELTRGLRAMGSQRGSPGPDQDQWFAALLSARRAVAGVSDAERQVALMNGPEIARTMQRTLSELAKTKAGDSAAMERALEAAFLEESDDTFVALQRMQLAGDALVGGALDTRLIDWRRWTDAVRTVFAAADNSWPRVARVLQNGV
jgi:hypothetical protein